MSEEENKAIVSQWREVLDGYDVEVAAAATLVTSDFVSHSPLLPEPLRALEAALSDIQSWPRMRSSKETRSPIAGYCVEDTPVKYLVSRQPAK
jgi:hypothetical protein